MRVQRRPHHSWGLGQLALKVANVRFEIIALSHLEGEKMVVVPLSLLVICVLGEERFRCLLEVVERLWRKGLE